MRTLQLRSERRYQWMCAGKKSYPTYQAAEHARQARLLVHPRLHLRFYICPICHNFHLTSQP